MHTLFALFSETQSLEQARQQFPGGRVIPGFQLEPEQQTHEGRAPLDSSKQVEGHTLEDELINYGVPAEQSRMFADALRSGSSLLMLEGDLEALREPLIEAGAGYVSGV
jgi:hypothetical protein